MLDRFINTFIITDVRESPFFGSSREQDMMLHERELRREVAERDLRWPGTAKESDVAWKFYYSHGNYFVDQSTFYSTLTHAAFDAATLLVAKEAGNRELVLWTYAAVTIWVNGEQVCAIDEPVYKPIMKKSFTVSLKAGENEVYVRLQTLGVRDTRSLFALEVTDPSDISCAVPAIAGADQYREAIEFLDNTTLVGDELSFPAKREDLELVWDAQSPDYSKVSHRYRSVPLGPVDSYVLDGESPFFLIRVTAGGEKLQRRFEAISEITAQYSEYEDVEENYQRMLRQIAAAEGLSRGDKFGFYIQNILARKALGIETGRDGENFLTTLQQIEDRYDCSDFLVSGVIRYLKSYAIDAPLKEKIETTLFNWRYWMSMEGSDGMCFWSENHSLLFYSSAMIVGSMYPEAYFPTARMTGGELEAFGERLTIQWLDDVEEYGFEEFLSTVYMNVTFASLLNIIDYAKSEISRRAAQVTDLMLRQLSLHTFDGAIIAPMGRVYRSVITPTKQGAQALMNLVNPRVPFSFGEGWLSYFATSTYQIPDGLVALMENPTEQRYSTGNAQVVIKKSTHYILTSVQSPRRDGFARWENVTLRSQDDVDRQSHLYTKSFNERFHGTTYFASGVYGYQQHLWSAALSNEAVVFANHPGGTSDSSSMRPGYWFGNGIMPALRQEGRVLGAIYEISEDYPIHFTHVFLPKVKFDEVEMIDRWIFARKGDGYLALWCSRELAPYDDELSGCEYRAWGSETAYLCTVGSADEDGSFDQFKHARLATEVEYDREGRSLLLEKKVFITYEDSDDQTQYV